MILRYLSTKLRRTAIFSWLISVVLGELNWIRKTRNRISRNTLIRNYSKWIDQVETKYSDLQTESDFSANTDHPVLILHRCDELLLDSMAPLITSLQSQKYPNWELHILSACKPPVELVQSLNLCILDGGSIDLWNLDELGNEGSALANRMKNSEFQLCLILDGDILLHPYALIEILMFFRSHPNADIIYTDEDRVSSQGERHSPWFKPDWSPELLYSLNYLKPLLINRETLDRIDDFWSAFLEGKYWHAILNHVMKMKPVVLHLSKILFHLRSHTKNWSYDPSADREHSNWLQNHMEIRGMDHPEVVLGSDDQSRVTWSTSNSSVSIIIPTKDNLNLLRRCINSLIERTDYEKYDIAIVDTGSENPETWQYYEETEFIKPVSIIRYKDEFNYSAVNNFGARAASGDYLLFLNNDVEIFDPDWLEELVRWIELPEIGVVGAKLLYPDHSIQHAGVILGLGGHAGHVFLGADENEIGPYGSTNWYRNFLAVTGACMIVDREIYERVGGFDEDFELVFSDIDLCIRIIESGYRVAFSPYARLIHRVGSTRFRFNPSSDLERGFTSFLPYLESGDPYYNRNLSYSDPFPKLCFGDGMNRVERVRRIVSRG